MKKYKVIKTYQEINEKIRHGKAVVVTAEEMIDVVERHGDVEAARRVDVVTTGTFSPMCSSGAFLNFGHPSPKIKASKIMTKPLRTVEPTLNVKETVKKMKQLKVEKKEVEEVAALKADLTKKGVNLETVLKLVKEFRHGSKGD